MRKFQTGTENRNFKKNNQIPKIPFKKKEKIFKRNTENFKKMFEEILAEEMGTLQKQ